MNVDYKKLHRNDNPDQPLQVEIKNKVLTISIGVNTLVFATEHKPKCHGDPEFTIKNNDCFVEDVANELRREQEDGTTPVHLLLDEAVAQAIENGSFFVDEVKSEP